MLQYLLENIMLIKVNKPGIDEFRIEGKVSLETLEKLKEVFKDSLFVEDDEWVDFENTDWYKQLKASRTPGVNLKFYRNQNKLTQKELGEKLGVQKQFISDMERARKPISKAMAKKLSELFNVSVSKFI